MFKFLRKLAALSLTISISLLSFAVLAPSKTANAADYLELLDPFGDSEQCINTDSPKLGPGELGPEDPRPGPDADYIITIIEEPLETDTPSNDANFKYRSCYRNTLEYRSPQGDVRTTHELLEECSTKGQDLANSLELKRLNYEVRFSCKEVLVILSKGGTSMLYGYIGMIYRWAARLVGLIAVLIIVVSGIQLSASGGDSEVINAAKGRIIKSLSGIAILFLSGLILNTANPNFYIFTP